MDGGAVGGSVGLVGGTVGGAVGGTVGGAVTGAVTAAVDSTGGGAVSTVASDGDGTSAVDADSVGALPTVGSLNVDATDDAVASPGAVVDVEFPPSPRPSRIAMTAAAMSSGAAIPTPSNNPDRNVRRGEAGAAGWVPTDGVGADPSDGSAVAVDQVIAVPHAPRNRSPMMTSRWHDWHSAIGFIWGTLRPPLDLAPHECHFDMEDYCPAKHHGEVTPPPLLLVALWSMVDNHQLKGALVSCTHCGQTIDDGVKFCTGCGRPTAATGGSAPTPPTVVVTRAVGANAPSAPAVPSTTAPGPISSNDGLLYLSVDDDEPAPPAPPILIPGATSIPASNWASSTISPPYATSLPPIGAQSESDSNEVTTSSVKSGKFRMIVFGAVGLAALAGVGAFLVTHGSDSGTSGSGSQVSLPAKVDRVWKRTFDSANIGFQGDGSTLYASSGTDNGLEIIRLDPKTGEEMWKTKLRSVDSGWISLVQAGDPIVTAYGSDGDSQVMRLSSTDGKEKWSMDLSNGGSIVEFNGHSYSYSTSGEGDVSADEELVAVDLETGDKGRRVKAPSVSISGAFAVARDGDRVEIYDLDTLDQRGTDIKIDDKVGSTLWTGSNLLTAVEDEIVAVDAKGDELWSDSSPVGYVYRFDLLPGGRFAVSGADGIAVVQPKDGQLDELWSENGSFGEYVGTGDKPVVLVNDGDQVLAIGLSDGKETASLDVVNVGDGGAPWSVFNHTLGIWDTSDGTRFEAYSLPDGKRLWSVDSTGYVMPIDGAVLTIESDYDAGETDVEFLN